MTKYFCSWVQGWWGRGCAWVLENRGWRRQVEFHLLWHRLTQSRAQVSAAILVHSPLPPIVMLLRALIMLSYCSKIQPRRAGNLAITNCSLSMARADLCRGSMIWPSVSVWLGVCHLCLSFCVLQTLEFCDIWEYYNHLIYTCINQNWFLWTCGYSRFTVLKLREEFVHNFPKSSFFNSSLKWFTCPCKLSKTKLSPQTSVQRETLVD